MPCPPSSSSFGNVLVVTSTTRPVGADLYVGRVIYELDTQRIMLWDGTGWIIEDEPWQTYTPAWSCLSGGAPALGNGTINGYYQRHGGSCWIDIVLIAGTTTTFGGGAFAFSLPGSVTSLNINAASLPLNCNVYDSSANLMYVGSAYFSANNTLSAYSHAAGPWAAAVPVTLATSDQLKINGQFQMTTRYL